MALRFAGRVKWVLLLFIAAVVVAGTWFYQFYFSSTDAAIRHAEAFLFRRMSVAQLAEQGGYRFFYTTNRQAIDDSGPVSERFGNVRAGELRYGHFDTDIKPSLGLGMLINPTEWFQNEEIQLREVTDASRAEFVRQLSAKVDESPHRGLLVVVHGFRDAYESALRKTAFLGHVLDINAPLLVFDWPGDQGSSLRGYRAARAVAEDSGVELAQMLELVVNEVQPDRLWVVANSMGAQVVVDAMSELYLDPAFADGGTEFEQIILTAPDISQEEFDNRFRDKILALSDHLTVYVSSNDRALLVSRLVNREPRQGESTLQADQLEQAVRIAQYMQPDDKVISLVDVTPVNRTRNFHNFSLETPEYFDDLFLRLSNEELPRSRLLYEVKTPEGRVYSVLTRGR